ncbi:MAG: chromosome partitioning protein ParB [Bacteroidetes bacterium]|jgi:ParB family chromosome partitioning protein|nr:chromosome partitioning protein ParB [Bacteroidota bacterium]
MSKSKSALGRGLGALLENAKTDITTKGTGETAAVVGSIASIPIKNIEANPFQPRTDFEEQALQELVDSIKEHGIIQPVTVRKLGFDKYQLISGERRFRASQIAGLKDIPAYVRIANDQEMLEMALVENIQRQELNPIEIALSYKRLIDECNLTQEKLADKVAKQRSTITNFLRLLKLPAEIQIGLKEKNISMGHARALINIEDKDLQLALFAKTIEENLSVREIEDLAKYGKVHTKVKVKAKQAPAPLSLSDKKINEKLVAIFNQSVKFKRNSSGTGNVTLTFSNDNELEHILSFFDIH